MYLSQTVLQVAFSSPSYTAQEPPQPSTSICLNVINGMLAPDSEVRVRFSLQQETATGENISFLLSA